MKYITLLLLLFLLSLLHGPVSSLGEQNADSLFERANSAYSKQDFTTAAELYEELIATHGYGSGLLYNLANSYAQLGQPGDAVLNYERALRLSPGNSDISGNLKLVKTHYGLFDQEKDITETFIHLLTMNQWVLLAAAFSGIFALHLLLSCRLSQLRRSLLPVGLCLTVVITISVYGALQLYGEWRGSVVVKPQTRLMISPFEGAASVGDIKEGRKVYPQDNKHREYSYVKDTTGREGWIMSNAIKPIVPE